MKLLVAIVIAAICLVGVTAALGGEGPPAAARGLVEKQLGEFLVPPGAESQVRIRSCRELDDDDTRCRFRATGSDVKCHGVIQVRDQPTFWFGWAKRLNCVPT